MAGLLQFVLQSSLGRAMRKCPRCERMGQHMELSVIAAVLAGSIGLSAALAYVMLSFVLVRCNVRPSASTARHVDIPDSRVTAFLDVHP
jgi:hypothetical protein